MHQADLSRQTDDLGRELSGMVGDLWSNLSGVSLDLDELASRIGEQLDASDGCGLPPAR